MSTRGSESPRTLLEALRVAVAAWLIVALLVALPVGVLCLALGGGPGSLILAGAATVALAVLMAILAAAP